MFYILLFFFFFLLHFTFTFHTRLCLFNTFSSLLSTFAPFLILFSFLFSSFFTTFFFIFLSSSWIFYLRSREHTRHENQRPVVSLGRVAGGRQTDRQTDDDLMRDEQTQGQSTTHNVVDDDDDDANDCSIELSIQF